MIRNKSSLKEKGQVTIEYLLITIVLVGFTLMVKNILAQSGAVPDLIKKPWAIVAGMLENGVWAEPAKARTLHPGKFNRHLSFEGDRE